MGTPARPGIEGKTNWHRIYLYDLSLETFCSLTLIGTVDGDLGIPPDALALSRARRLHLAGEDAE